MMAKNYLRNTAQPHPYILYVHESEQMTGSDFYRMVLPANVLSSYNKVVNYINHKKSPELIWNNINNYDILVFPRMGVKSTIPLTPFKIVVEVDDDFTNEHRVVLPDKFYANFWNFCNQANAIIASTPYLADLMGKRTGKPVYVFPNSVRPADWRVPKRKQLTIALTGSNTHYDDWQILAEALPYVLEMNVRLLVGGFFPDYLEPLRQRFPEKVEFFPWATYQNYARMVGGCHIVLCPLSPVDKFNLSKSGIKAIEGMASGATVIASNVEPYKFIRHGHDGFLVSHKPETYRELLLHLIDNPDSIYATGAIAMRTVSARYNIFENVKKLWGIFRSIYADN